MLSRFIERARAIDKNAIVERVLSKHTDELVALQQKRLHSGLNTDQSIIQPFYSDSWGKVRRKAGKQTSFVDTDYSGKHFSKMFAKVGATETTFGSDTKVADYLVGMFSEKLYGLSDEDMNTLLTKQGIRNEILAEYKKALLN